MNTKSSFANNLKLNNLKLNNLKARRFVYACTLSLALTTNAAFAQQQAAPPPAPPRAPLPPTITPPNVDVLMPAFDFNYQIQGVVEPMTFNFVSSEFGFDNKVVKGAPYAAEAVTESVQTLADGNRITRRSSSQIYRDSEGRTRREQQINQIGNYTANAASENDNRPVFINDPVSGFNYVLESRTRTARKLPSFQLTNLGNLNVQLGRMNDALQRHQIITGNAQKQLADAARLSEQINRSIVIDTDDNAEGGAKKKTTTRVVVNTIKDGKASTQVYEGAEAEKAIADLKIRKESSETSDPNLKTEKLESRMIEGVMAEGTRTTRTIPAGKIGNEQPINIVNERWYAPDLQVVVMSKRSDPRTGETTYRLTNINRSEPSRALFEIPADYTVKDTAEPFRFQTRTKKTKE